jgi:hypothetical protein
MSDQTTTTTGTGTSNLYPIGWVRVEHVEALVSASDDFNMFLVIALTFLGIAAAAAVALTTTPKNPLPLYLIIAAPGGVGAFSTILAVRERGNVRRTRQNLKQETRNQYVPSPFPPLNLNAGTNQSPTVTIGSTGNPPETSPADQSTEAQET